MLTNIKNHVSNITIAALVVLCLTANISAALDDIRSAEIQEVAHASH